ncbi:hypothetical protein [Nocardioides stalactiti]|uniref:hypothetical protein n=1 Tax=Nocardioides stalactiti TaxID=2755356 RepID=UPI0016008931|nr:hypothetical protein [Nocardioides stalactiti]
MSCYRIARDQPRLVRNRHDPVACPMVGWHPPLAWDCDGCQPCTRPHCSTCDREHVTDLTCPNCISEIRTNIERIVELTGLPLVDELLTRGNRSEAAHLLGPTAHVKQWQQRRKHGYRNHRDDVVGLDHPLWVLGVWDLMITEHYGHIRTANVTVTTAADYIKRNLSDLAQDPLIDFPAFAGEIAQCKTHLETVLRADEQVERAAPCVKCGTHLVKAERGYRCTRCHDDLTENQYHLAVKAAHIKHADRLNADDLAQRIGVPASTIRSWASVMRVQRKGEQAVELAPLIRSCGRDGGNRKVYRVADAVAIRDAGGDHRRAARSA